jgi:hypothetical protein
MAASQKQMKLIRDLMNEAGAPIHEHPIHDRAIDIEEELHLVITSVEEADAYIKANYKLMLKADPTLIHKAWTTEASERTSPDCWNIPNM